MRVLYILHTADLCAGATRSWLIMLRGLLSLGIQARVLLPVVGPLCKELDQIGVEWSCLNFRPNLYPYERRWFDYLLWVPRLIARRLVNRQAVRTLSKQISDIDLIHTNVSVIDIGQRAALCAHLPHIYHFREYGDLDFSYRYYPNKSSFLSKVTYSICITQGIQKHHGLQSDPRSHVIYNPIIDNSAESSESNPSNYLLFASRLEQTKGLDDLLEAYYRANCKYPLWVAGAFFRSDYQGAIYQKIKTLGLTDKVRFLGNCTDILDLMRGAKAVIVPSHSEAFGRVMAEAMACGTLVIARDTGGLREQFNNGLRITGHEIGLRFQDIEGLTQCIRDLDGVDPSMRQRALHAVQTIYTAEQCARQVYDFYKEILASSKKL